MTTCHRFYIGFTIFIFLVACSAPSTTSTPTQSSQPVPEVDDSFEPTPTITVLPTATRRPSATPSPSPTIDLTETVVYQDTLAAQAMEETLASQFPHVCEYSYGPLEFSPNGLWMAESCYNDKYQDNILTISNKDSQILWELVYQDYIAPIEFPGGVLLAVHWAKDGRYVYFLSNIGGSGAECFYQSRDRGAGLFRLDLQSGWVTTILPPSNDFWWYGFSFSPTDRRLVYGARARDLKILDIATGKTSDIISGDNNYETGGYLWSSDGLQLVYSVLTYDEQGERENYSLRLVDTQNGMEQILFESPENCYSASSWATNSILIIEREGRDGQSLIEYDLNSNKIISEATETPRP